jgi:hypothetical protein
MSTTTSKNVSYAKAYAEAAVYVIQWTSFIAFVVGITWAVSKIPDPPCKTCSLKVCEHCGK